MALGLFKTCETAVEVANQRSTPATRKLGQHPAQGIRTLHQHVALRLTRPSHPVQQLLQQLTVRPLRCSKEFARQMRMIRCHRPVC